VQLKNDVLELMELKHRIIIVFKGSHFVTQKLHVPYGADVKVCYSKHSVTMHLQHFLGFLSTDGMYTAASTEERPTNAETAQRG